MTHANPAMEEPELAAILEKIKKVRASVSLRAEGAVKLLGHLRVRSLEPGVAIHLEGAKLRDSLPPAGTAVTLTLILGDEVITIATKLLESLPSLDEPKRASILRAAWPTEPLRIHPRRAVRVATPDLPPLEASIRWQGRDLQAKLLNLTDMGMGLGLADPLTFGFQDRVEVMTNLPGAPSLTVFGAVRHSEALDGDALPTRVGLVLEELPAETRETLQQFIQARRTDRSFSMRSR